MTIRELEQLIEEYGKDILSFCVHLSGSVTEGEELYQEVFVRAMDKLAGIRMEQNPKSYLLGMALKIWGDMRRKAARRNTIVPMTSYEDYMEDMTEQTDSPEAGYEEQERRTMVQRAVQMLPDKYRAVILLFYMQELSMTEIAELLEVPKGTVASRLHTAKNLLRERLEDYYGKI